MTITDNFAEILSKKKIKPSYPRIKVLEYLVVKKSHPTVDEIYNELVKDLPTLSKTTVYNTLNLFIKTDIARLVTIEDNETRYDADVSNHGHFKCEVCGRIFDFDINIDKIKTEGLSNFRIKEKNVYYKGVCSHCLDNKNEN
ncbi:MAG: Fur family transcriptional regulator [Bacillota bacterium]